jgi:hypothetical protein
MRTAIFIACGILLWAGCIAAAKLTSGSGASLNLATLAFAGIWLCVSAANLWVGVSKAGYTFAEEMPIFLLIFLVPTALAVWVKWKWL